MTDIQATAQPLAKSGQTSGLGGPAEATSGAAFEGLFAVLDMIGAETAAQPELAARLAAVMGDAEQNPSAELASIQFLPDADRADAALAALSGDQNGEAENRIDPAASIGLPDALKVKTTRQSAETRAQVSADAPEAGISHLSADILARFSHDDLAHLQHQARRLLKDGQQASPNVKALVALLDEKLARAARKKTGTATPHIGAMTENQPTAQDPSGLTPQHSLSAQNGLPETAKQPADRATPILASNILPPASTAGTDRLASGGEQPHSRPAGAGKDAAFLRGTHPHSGQNQSGQSLSDKTEQPVAGQKTTQKTTQLISTSGPLTSRAAGQKPGSAQLEIKANQPVAEESRLAHRLPTEPVPTRARLADPAATARSSGAVLPHPVISAGAGKQQDSAELGGRKKQVSLAEAAKKDPSGLLSQTLSSAAGSDRSGGNVPATKSGAPAGETPPAQARAAQAQPVQSENPSHTDTATEHSIAEERSVSRSAGSQAGLPAGSANGGAALQRLNMLAKGWQDNLVKQAEKALLEGRETVRLVLNPRHLGRLQLSLGLSGDQAHIQIQADTAATAQLLGESEARLQQMLEAAGLRLASLNTGSGFGAGGQQSSRQQEAENSSDRPAAVDAEKNLTENSDKTDKEFLNILA